jgi:hypothetical protein
MNHDTNHDKRVVDSTAYVDNDTHISYLPNLYYLRKMFEQKNTKKKVHHNTLPSELVVLGGLPPTCVGIQPTDQVAESTNDGALHSRAISKKFSFCNWHPFGSRTTIANTSTRDSIDVIGKRLPASSLLTSEVAKLPDKLNNRKKENDVIFSRNHTNRFIPAHKSLSFTSLVPNTDVCSIDKENSIYNNIHQQIQKISDTNTYRNASVSPKNELDPNSYDLRIPEMVDEEVVVSIYNPNSEFNSSKIKCKNMDTRLAVEAGITNYNKMEEIEGHDEWIPPSIHGLGNSERIIPNHYIPSNMNRNNVLRIDYHFMILDDIRNMRPLNEHHLNYIKNTLNDSEKHKIIVEFNKVITSYSDIMLHEHDDNV